MSDMECGTEALALGMVKPPISNVFRALLGTMLMMAPRRRVSLIVASA